MTRPPAFRTIDLFAGAGGMSLGFELANVGFKPVFAVEIDEAAARTFKARLDPTIARASRRAVNQCSSTRSGLSN